MGERGDVPAAQRDEGALDQAGKLRVPSEPGDSSKANVEGKTLNRPIDGFGQLWRKTYRLPLTGAKVTREQVAALWKERLPDLMPEHSRFYPTLHGVTAGEVVLIQADLPGGMPVSTGVLVVAADDISFTVGTPQGHPEAGYNRFSAEQEGETVIAQIQSLGRAADPLFEFGYRFMGGAKHQEGIWHHLLTRLGEQFGVRGEVQMRRELLDGGVHWQHAGNLWHNSAIRTTVQTPLRLAKRLTGRK